MSAKKISDVVTKLLSDSDMDNFYKAGFNIILRGRHGVGKTSRIKSCLERHGLVLNESYLYFSCPTLDPWVDFVGVPKERTDSNGNVYLDFIRPKSLASGNIKAIVLDEYNRSHKKIRNAAMELLQYKTINGMTLPNLKVVWAAVNPDDEDETYDVEKIDEAQLDRFHTKMIELPYDVSKEYFAEKYNQLGESAVEWWMDLPSEIKDRVSPRRLEYALNAFKNDISLDFILPRESNINKLLIALNSGPILDKLETIFKGKNETVAKVFLSNSNNYNASLKYILANNEMMDFFLPLAPKEQIATLVSKNMDALDYVTQKIDTVPVFDNVITNMIKTHKDQDLRKKIKKAWEKAQKKTTAQEMPENAEQAESETVSKNSTYNPTTASDYAHYAKMPVINFSAQLLNYTENPENQDKEGLTINKYLAEEVEEFVTNKNHSVTNKLVKYMLDNISYFFTTDSLQSINNDHFEYVSEEVKKMEEMNRLRLLKLIGESYSMDYIWSNFRDKFVMLTATSVVELQKVTPSSIKTWDEFITVYPEFIVFVTRRIYPLIKTSEVEFSN